MWIDFSPPLTNIKTLWLLHRDVRKDKWMLDCFWKCIHAHPTCWVALSYTEVKRWLMTDYVCLLLLLLLSTTPTHIDLEDDPLSTSRLDTPPRPLLPPPLPDHILGQHTWTPRALLKDSSLNWKVSSQCVNHTRAHTHANTHLWTVKCISASPISTPFPPCYLPSLTNVLL